MFKIKLLIFVGLFFPLITNAQIQLTASGPANSFNVTYPANLTNISPGMMVTFFSNQSISSNTTLNLNGLGPQSILKNLNQPLASGDILTGQPITVIYDGTNWQLLSTTAATTSSQWTSTTSGAIFYSGGNVGIGTNVPNTNLTLAPTHQIGWNYSSGNSSVAHTIGRSSQGATPLEFKTTFNPGPTSPIFQFIQSNGTPSYVMSMLYNGNVGIGTATPANNLDVAGGVRIQNLSTSGAVFANALGDLFINTATGVSGSGSAGAITFWNNTNSLASDPTNLFWNNSSKRLGIGINTPSYQVDQRITAVTGSEFLSHYYVSDAPGELFIKNYSTLATEFIPQIYGNQIGLGSALVLSGETNNDSNINDPEMVVVNGTFAGGVALGFKPIFAVKNGGSNRFQVAANGGITIASLTSSGTNLVQANAQGRLSLVTSSSYNLWTVSGSNIFPQTAASNLGIGLGSATVPGIISGASRYITLAANQTNTTGYPSVELFSINGTLNSPVSKLDFINVHTPVLSAFANHARIQAFTGRGAVSNGQLGFFTYNGSLNEVMRINENGGVAIGSTYTPTSPPGMGLMVQGNVGIGTSTPITQLHIHNINDANMTLSTQGAANTDDIAFNLITQNNATGSLVLGNAASRGWLIGARGGAWSAISQANDFFISGFDGTSWNQIFNIDMGNKFVGIGTISPSALLDVSAATGAEPRIHITNLSSGNAVLELRTASAGAQYIDFTQNSTSNTLPGTPDRDWRIIANGSNFQIQTSTTGYVYYADQTSRVGIGTLSPAAKLHVQSLGTASTTNAFSIDNSALTNLLTLKENGFLGLGTSTPSANLEVNGTFVLGTNGTVLTEVIRANVVFDIPSVTANSGTTVNLTVPGATVGSTAYVSPSASLSLIIASAWVNVAGNVQMVVFNPTGLAVNPASMTFYVTVIR